MMNRTETNGRRHHLGAGWVIGVSIAASAAVAAEQNLLSVAPGAASVKSIGYEVSPPQGNHWFMYARNEPGWVTFSKRDPAWRALPDGALHSFVVEIKAERHSRFDLKTSAGLEAALNYALYEKPAEFKYSLPRFDHFQWQGTNCIRYSMTRAQADAASGQAIPFVWAVEGVFCRHPDSSNIAVTGLYQERRPAQATSLLDESSKREAQAVLDSIRLVKMGPGT